MSLTVIMYMLLVASLMSLCFPGYQRHYTLYNYIAKRSRVRLHPCILLEINLLMFCLENELYVPVWVVVFCPLILKIFCLCFDFFSVINSQLNNWVHAPYAKRKYLLVNWYCEEIYEMKYHIHTVIFLTFHLKLLSNKSWCIITC